MLSSQRRMFSCSSLFFFLEAFHNKKNPQHFQLHSYCKSCNLLNEWPQWTSAPPLKPQSNPLLLMTHKKETWCNATDSVMTSRNSNMHSEGRHKHSDVIIRNAWLHWQHTLHRVPQLTFEEKFTHWAITVVTAVTDVHFVTLMILSVSSVKLHHYHQLIQYQKKKKKKKK